VTGITANNKEYDGTTSASLDLSSPILVGVVSPDVVTPNTLGATGAFSSKDVGTGTKVTVAGVTLGGLDAANYTLTQPTPTASITPKALVVSAVGVNKVYDGTPDATVTLSDDRVAGDALTTSYTSAAFADKNVGTGKAISVSGIDVSGPDVGNYTFNTTAGATADITPRTLTVSATGVNKIYDGATTATVILSDDRVPGDVLTVQYTTANFTDKNVGSNKMVTVTGITVTGVDAGNYTFNTNATTTANITNASVWIYLPLVKK
jgi:hypothetical protein